MIMILYVNARVMHVIAVLQTCIVAASGSKHFIFLSPPVVSLPYSGLKQKLPNKERALHNLAMLT